MPPFQIQLQRYVEENGYDIVYVDFEEGAGDIVENAYVVMEVINWVNEQKELNNSTEKNIVWGPSMGGVIARYALCTMEEEGTPHDVSYYYSDDAPHLGANILLGFQHMIDDMYHYSILGQRPAREQVAPMYEVLATDAAKQLLRKHGFADGEPMPEHDILQQELANLGMPTQTEANIAMSRGSGVGNSQDIPASGNMFTVNVNSFNVLSTFDVTASEELSWIAGFTGAFALITGTPFGAISEVQMNVNALPNDPPGEGIVYERKVRASFVFQLLGQTIFYPIWDPNVKDEDNTDAYDSSPGGYFELDVEASDGEESLLSQINDYQPNVSLNYTKFNFVPTFSALNMPTYEDDPFANIDTESIITNDESTFDRAFIQDPTLYTTANIENNEAHAEQTPSSVRAFQAFTLNFVEMQIPGDEIIGQNDEPVNVSQAVDSSGEIVRVNDRVSEQITLESSSDPYNLCVNCNDRINEITDSSNPQSDIEEYNLSLVEDCDGNIGEITIRNGATLKIGESANKRANVMIGYDAIITVESGGKIEINEGSKLIVQGNGKLVLGGGQIVNNGGEIIVGYEGELDYGENSDIQLNGHDAILSVAGNVYIGNNATFTFSYTGTESGHIEIPESSNPEERFYSGENTEIYLEGESDDDLILDIIDADCWLIKRFDGDPPVKTTFKKGKVYFHDDSRLYIQANSTSEFYAYNCHFTHPPSQLPSGYSNRGIRLGGDSRFIACEFTRVPIDGRLDFNYSGMLKLTSCDLDRSDVYVKTRGFRFMSSNFESSEVRTENCTVLSEIVACDFHRSPVIDISSNDLMVDRSSFDDASGYQALFKDAGRLLLSCSEFTYNDIAVQGITVEIVMSDTRSTGYNTMYGNDINIKTYNLQHLDIAYGYNKLLAGDDFNIDGLWSLQFDNDCPTVPYSVDFRGNLWSANPPTSVPAYPYPDPAQFDLYSRANSANPFQDCYVDPQFGSIIVQSQPPCPSAPEGPGKSSTSESDTTLVGYFADVPNDSIPLVATDTYGEILADTALYLATNLLEVNDSLSQNSMAMSTFKDVLTSLKDSISHEYTWKLAFDGISGMKTAFEHEESKSDFEGVSEGGFTPMVQDYVDILMLYTDSVKTEENYNRQFYLETKKASLFNTLGNLNLAEQILGNLNLCEHDSLEQDYLDKYSNMLGNQIALSEVSSYELMMDSTLSETLLDSTYSSSPPNQIVGDQGFAAFIEGPNTVQFTTCPVGQQKSLDISSQNKASLTVVPNPALDFVTVSSFVAVTEKKTKGELQVFSSQGRKVFSQEYVIDGRFSERISVEHLTVGSYIVVLNVNGKAYRAHLVVVK